MIKSAQVQPKQESGSFTVLGKFRGSKKRANKGMAFRGRVRKSVRYHGYVGPIQRLEVTQSAVSEVKGLTATEIQSLRTFLSSLEGGTFSRRSWKPIKIKTVEKSALWSVPISNHRVVIQITPAKREASLLAVVRESES